MMLEMSEGVGCVWLCRGAGFWQVGFRTQTTGEPYVLSLRSPSNFYTVNQPTLGQMGTLPIGKSYFVKPDGKGRLMGITIFLEGDVQLRGVFFAR